MKKVILKTSAGLVISASTIAILVTLFGSSGEWAVKWFSVSGFLGLGSIGLFFVGLAYPSTSVVKSTTIGKGSITETKVS